MARATEGRAGPWWRGAVGYEVYVRSFDDSDGDGVGDLPGVRARLDHLEWLGVDVVWLTPFYRSPQADHGYDVSDHRAVDPRLGTLTDVDAIVDDAPARGLRVVVDLVPNHPSDRHRGFRSACRGRSSPHRDWYVWRDPAPDGSPPNNWVSHFGGPAWTLHEPTGQYYLHLFLPEQPDLNWRNPAVRRAFDGILRFWLARGVDGVRIDVAHALLKDPELRDNPPAGDPDGDADPPAGGADPRRTFAAFEHRHDLDQAGVVEIYRRWRRIAARHRALLLGEVYLLEPERLTRYVTGDGLHLAFSFPTLKVGWDARAVRRALRGAVEAGGAGIAWPLSSHDDPRAPTRFGGGERGARRALAYLTLLCALPGVPFLLQGDELGLEDGRVPRGSAADPITVRNRGATGRDGSRTPMPWRPGPALGFTDGRPWLPTGDNHTGDDTVRAQRRREDSHLHRVRRLLAVRRRAGLGAGVSPEWLRPEDGAEMVAFRAGDVLAAANLGPGTAEVDAACLPGDGAPGLLYASGTGAGLAGTRVRVPTDTAVLVRRDPPPGAPG